MINFGDVTKENIKEHNQIGRKSLMIRTKYS